MSELPLFAAIVRAGNTVVVKCTSHPSSQILVTVVMSFRPTCLDPCLDPPAEAHVYNVVKAS